jgi:hypothetical protein
VTDVDVASRVRTFLNFDGTGAGGPALLFETGPGWGAPLSAWASGAPAPTGASFGAEIYRRLPNDTDFTVFKTLGASGLNFAPVADSYAYHTDRDIAARVEAATLSHEIGNTIGTVRALDGMEWGPPVDSPTYFDIFSLHATVYPGAVGRVLIWFAVALAVVTWVVITRDLWRVRATLGLVLTASWAIVTSALTAGLAIAAATMVRRLRAELNPWYAAPHWFFLFVTAVGCLAAWHLHRLAWRLPDRWHPVRSPAAVWWVTLPVWTALAALLHIAAPAAAYLVGWPLLVAGVLVLLCRRSPAGMLVASGLVFLVAVALWARNTWMLLRFMVPLFGWLPVTAPVWVYPALIAIAALFIVPPLIAMTSGRFNRALRSRPVELVLTGVALAAGILAWVSPAYTPVRPQMRTVWYVQDNPSKLAWWEVGGSEPAAGLGVPGPVGASWKRSDDAVPASVRIGGIDAPFTFRTSATPTIATAPAEVSAKTARASDGRMTLDVTIVPRLPLAFRLSLPAGVRPSTSSLAGVVDRDVWQATYVAPPPAGVIVHLTFEGRSTADLQGAAVLFVVAGVPGDARGGWPAWLPRERDAWHARTMLIETVGAGR